MLGSRNNRVLTWVVRLYLQTGVPVGSGSVSKKCGLNLSPASIRKVMAHLEESGMLYAPHTSAGRAPTDLGLRYFVDVLMTAGESIEDQIEKTIADKIMVSDAQEVIQETSKKLANLTHFAGLGIIHGQNFTRINKIELIPVSAQQVLAVIISNHGHVHHQLLMRDALMSDARLNEITCFLSEMLTGCSLSEARSRLQHEMETDRLRIRRLIRGLTLWTGKSGRNSAKMFVSGQKQLLDIPELGVIDTVRSLLVAFEDKKVFMRLIDQVERTSGDVRVFIGSEHALLHMEQISVVLARYQGADQLQGALGVIGPRRMHYEHVLPLVEQAARRVSTLLGGSFG